jgi:hypothetical protein
LPRPTARATVGGECNTAARENSKPVVEEKSAAHQRGYSRFKQQEKNPPVAQGINQLRVILSEVVVRKANDNAVEGSLYLTA